MENGQNSGIGRRICQATAVKAKIAAVAAIPSCLVALLTTPGTVFEPMIEQYLQHLQLSPELMSQIQDVSLATLFASMAYALLAPPITAKLTNKLER